MGLNILQYKCNYRPASIDLSNYSKLPVQGKIEQLAVGLDGTAARDLTVCSQIRLWVFHKQRRTDDCKVVSRTDCQILRFCYFSHSFQTLVYIAIEACASNH